MSLFLCFLAVALVGVYFRMSGPITSLLASSYVRSSELNAAFARTVFFCVIFVVVGVVYGFVFGNTPMVIGNIIGFLPLYVVLFIKLIDTQKE